MLMPSAILTTRLSGSTACTSPPEREPTKSVPFAPSASERAFGTWARTSMRKPGGSLICSSGRFWESAGTATLISSAARTRLTAFASGRCCGALARGLEGVGDLGVAEAQRELDRGVAFLGDRARVGAVAQQQLDHAAIALHRGVGERRVAVFVLDVGVEVHLQNLLRIHEVALLDRVEEGADAFRALFLGLGLQACRHQLDDVVDERDADHGDEREHHRDLRDVDVVGELLVEVGAEDEQHHREEEEELEIEEQAEDDAAA